MNRQYEHKRGADGRVEIMKGRQQPRQLRGVGQWSEGTVRIGPMSRLLGAPGDRIGR